MKAGKLNEAIADFTHALDMDMNMTAALRERGLAYKLLGNFDAARDDLNLFLPIQPNDEEIVQALKDMAPTGRSVAPPQSPSPAAPSPAPNGVDHVLFSWSGNGSKNTRPFSVERGWEIQWESDRSIYIRVYDRSGNFVSGGASQHDPGSGSSFQPLGGYYYLDISGGGAWTVRIVAIAEDDKAKAEGDNPLAEGKSAETPELPTPPPAAPSLGKMPTIEKNFINIVEGAKERYFQGATDLQKGAARPLRAQDICAVFHGQAADWIGTITELTTNGDGYGVVKIEIAHEISVKTFSNSFSDIGSDTLIAPDSPLYRTLLGLKPQTKVRLSGSFFNDRSDCVREMSLTMDGSMTEPEFLFRFAAVESLGS